MRKRERENPCGVCGHYHRCEEGEVCGVCGHRPPGAVVERGLTQPAGGAFASEILREFLYLGGYDNACRGELLKAQGISHILNVSRFLHAAPLAFLWPSGLSVFLLPHFFFGSP